MRIAHICLAAFYIDDFGYQENILPRVHKRMGHDGEIIASTETYVEQTRLGYVQPSSYMNCDGIWVHRLPYASWVPKPIRSKVRAYQGLWEKLTEFVPDLIFLHDVQFWDILTVRKYALQHKVPVRADGHTDFVNSARGFVSRRLLHGIYYRSLVRFADSAIERYFPTLPARGDFMQKVYGLSGQKMEILPFGFDDTSFAKLDRAKVRKEVRENLGLADSSLVFITGGKLDLRKNIHRLIESYSRLQTMGKLANSHLLVFGEPNRQVAEALKEIDIGPTVHFLGWVEAGQLYRYFWCADVAVFPGTHSVVWEEAIGHGLATVLHRWTGMEHVDLCGNALFIEDASLETLDRAFLTLTQNENEAIARMTKVASARGPEVFAFSQIAEKAIAP